MVLHLILVASLPHADGLAEAASATLAAGIIGLALIARRRARPGSDRSVSAANAPSLAFPNYTQISSRISVPVWQSMRVGSLLGGLGVVALLVLAPPTGLFVMWRVVIPSLPALFLIAPGLWRNLCPLAAANQAPRALGITRALTPPAWLKEYGYVIAFSLFVLFVELRRLGLDQSGIPSALLLFGAMAAAFTGGIFLKGKAGWCSSICPLLPVQRIYGQTPLVMIANAHCQPCVGCAKHCYDFNPRAAYLSDLNDPDAYWGGYRRLFVGAFPGLVLSFFVIPRSHALAGLLTGLLFMAVSVALFTLVSTFWKTSSHNVTALFGALAFVIFYWFAGAFGPMELTWLIRSVAILLAVTWLVRTTQKERGFHQRAGSGGAGSAAVADSDVPSAGAGSLGPAGAAAVGAALVSFADGTALTPDPGMSLLELAEAHRMPIETGCRMGICGADPVAITDGMACTSPIGEDERATLDRLGLGPNTRLACCVRVNGPVRVSLEPEAGGSATVAGFPFDPAVRRVVIIGNGIAGVTVADQLRRRHPEVSIDLVAAEPHHLYNRMGIARLIYGRSGMAGLYLNPEDFYEQRRISTWLNTRAVAIDRAAQSIRLGTGEVLNYDRLVLATGSDAAVPAVDGFGVTGTGVLRSADDAMSLRALAQSPGVDSAVIAGGGLLGLEAASALGKLGLRTTVLERSERLLRRQLDTRAAEILQGRLEGMGITVRTRAEVRAAVGERRLEQVTLADGHRLGAQILLLAAGIRPRTALARRAQLEVNRGILVDARMCTSDRRIFAVGDAAEFVGEVPGLWATATAQAEVAAENIAGGDRAYRPSAPVTALKVAGIDLVSIGRAAGPGDVVVVADGAAGAAVAHGADGAAAADSYVKLVIDADGRPVGAILLDADAEVAAAVRTAVGRDVDLGDRLDALRAGDWGALAAPPLAPSRAPVMAMVNAR